MSHRTLRYLTLLLGLALAGTCAAASISEAELNRQLVTQLRQRGLEHNVIHLRQPQQQLQLELQLSDVQLQLLEQRGGIARVSLASDLDGQLILFGQRMRLKAQLEPEMESGLRYAEGALYLVQPRLTRLALKGPPADRELLQPLLALIQPALEQELARYFDHYPVYRLEHSLEEKLAAQALQSVAIRDGRLELRFREAHADNF